MSTPLKRERGALGLAPLTIADAFTTFESSDPDRGGAPQSLVRRNFSNVRPRRVFQVADSAFVARGLPMCLPPCSATRFNLKSHNLGATCRDAVHNWPLGKFIV